MPKKLHYRRSRSVRERPRHGRVWAAVAMATAFAIVTNGVILTVADDARWGAFRSTLLIAAVANGVLAVVSLAGTWIVRRVSSGASVIPYVIICLGLPVVCIVADFLFIGFNQGGAAIKVQRRIVVGNELRLLVETYRTQRSFMSHSSKTSNVKGYLITVDLSSREPLAQHARVYGPLWDVPNSRSSISFSSGANFTKADADAARATPMCVFDTDGALLKLTIDSTGKTLTREAFVATPNAGSWERQGDVKPVDDHLGPMSEDRLLTPSGRFILLYQNGQANLFDLFTGEHQDDPWLTKCFAHARSIKELKNVRLFLTDDLNHLVVSPEAIWNTSHSTVETFQLNGKTYNRADVGLAYSRPDIIPKVFPRPKEEKRKDGPHGAFSIERSLYLFMNDDQSLRLYTSDGKNEYRTNANLNPVWPLYPYLEMQHVPADNELIIFDHDAFHQTATTIRWNYKKGTVARHDTQIIDLFKRSGGQLRPRSLIEVK